MKLKTKLRIGLSFLFLMVCFYGGICMYLLNDIADNSKIILEDNYKSIKLVGNMRAILDDQEVPLNAQSAASFEKQLSLEKNNITESGEERSVNDLGLQFSIIINPRRSNYDQVSAAHKAKVLLRNVERINMKAIERKNDKAQKVVKQGWLYLSFTGTICFLVLFSFVLNFPSFIANPLQKLSEGIKEIGRKNYKQRIDFQSNDEFADLARSFNEMAAKLFDWENSSLSIIKSEKLRIEAIIEQMEDAIIGLNEQQEVLFINSKALQLFNLAKQRVIGHNAGDLTQTSGLFKIIMEKTSAQESIRIMENGAESFYQLETREIMVPVGNQTDDFSLTKTSSAAGKVYILRNITRFKALDQAKTNFIATVSHELKTPIASIKMSIKLLKDQRVGSTNEEQDELVTNIEEDTDRLLKITSELLNLSQAETGNIQLNLVKTNPYDIVNYAIKSMRFQADQKGVKLEFICSEKCQAVYADIEKTAWVLINFLSNALRYSPENSKIVIQLNEKSNWMEFSVRDFGKGIEDYYKSRIFDRYFQIPADGTSKPGTGLGLAISKDFIEAQNGHIYLESELGKGSQFSFQLPFHK
jgi:NtrC-family two-component system sensor histidine kinase KinB